MTIAPEFLDEIRTRVPLAGIVGRRVKLARRGREHIGLCPFHNEKTPSFTVNEDKGFFHCFGCGAHGDVIGFLMRNEGLSFPEAVERLAAEAGLPMPPSSREDRAAAGRRADLLETVEAAAAWFEEQLLGPGGAAARSYLDGRGIAAESISGFRLGFAPPGRDRLRAALNARGIDDGRLLEGGLIKGSEDDRQTREYFLNRVIFPIADGRGRVVAFGGRALGDSRAKYLNSPESPLFHKGGVLYNLARARPAAHDTGELIVVEGYMDVIALTQAGFAAVVAPLGTAVTDQQIAALWRMAEEPVLCLDGDEAGRRAGFRAAERALAQLRPGRSLRFAILPRGEDPDSLVRASGAAAMRAVLAAARPLANLVWLMETETRRFDSPERQAGLIQALEGRLRSIPDADVRTAYRDALGRQFADAFGYAAWGRPRAGWRKNPGRQRPGGHLGRVAGSARAAPARFQGLAGPLGGRQAPGQLARRREQVLLAAFVNHPVLIVEYAEDLAEIRLSNDELNAFSHLLVDLSARDPNLDSTRLRCHLSEHGCLGVLGRILRPEVYVHGQFAAPGASPDKARRGVRDILEAYRRRRMESESEEAGNRLAETMTEEDLARLEARQRLLGENEEIRAGADYLDEAENPGSG